MEIDIFTLMEKETGWSRELLYQLVDNVKDYAIFVADLDGQIVSWNIGAEKIFGYTSQEAIGRNCRILFTDEDRAKNVPEAEMKTAREEGSAEDERWHIRKDGSLFFASGMQTALYDETGKHTGYAKIARDLTDRVTIEEELQEAKDNLEFKVEERTSELAESNESLRREVVEREQSEKLRVALLRKIVTTQEDERKRIAREIHDHIGQQMTALQLNLQLMRDEFEKDSTLAKRLTQLQSIADRIDSDVDFLAWELRPSVLDELGLHAALKKFVGEWSQHFKIPAEFESVGLDGGGNHLLPEIEINLYRIAQEALNNIYKHAKAKNVSVVLAKRDGNIVLIIEDDGIGFVPKPMPILNEEDRGLGLVGMKERAELIKGTFEIESSPGKGATVYVRVPAVFDESTT
jgi:PAS domain S-box-containing protein